MEPRLRAVCCTDGQSYSDRQCADGFTAPGVQGLAFDFVSDCEDHHPRCGRAAAWPDSRGSIRWHSLACTARLPLGTTNHVRRFSPLAEGLW